MERTAAAHEYGDLIDATETTQMPNIHVTDRVMERVQDLEAGRRPLRARGFLRKSTLLGSLATLMLLLSVTAYAASEYIEIRNKAGELKVQYLPDGTGTITDSPYNGYAAKALKQAKPGELMAFYVKNRKDPDGAELGFVYKEKPFKTYTDFAAETTRTGAPELPVSVSGYAFESGNVGASIPDMLSDEYRETLAELKRQASNSPDGKNLFVMPLPWDRAHFVSGTYAKDDGASILLSVILLNDSQMHVLMQKEQVAETLTVAGTNVIYNEVNREKSGYSFLTWYDEGIDAYYRLVSTGGNPLTKEQYLKLAEEIIGS